MELTKEQEERLSRLYSDAIEGIADCIAGERAWAFGTHDERIANMHLGNVRELECWQENLETIMDNIGRVPCVSLSDMQKAWLEGLYDAEITESEGDAEWIAVLEELKDGVPAL